eukprot:5186801-Prymnesium_polylepis.3
MPPVLGRCANPSYKAPDGRLLRYLNNTVCCRTAHACQAYESAQVAVRRAHAVHDDVEDQPEQCYVIERERFWRSRMRLERPERAEASRGGSLSKQDQDIAYQVRGQFGVDEADARRSWIRYSLEKTD